MLVLGIALTLPFVQTKIAQYVTSELYKTYGTDINIDEVSITIFGGVKLKRVDIKDHHQNTFISANVIKTNILDLDKMIDGDLYLGDVILEGLIFKQKTYKGEKENNFTVFINAFDDGTPSTKKFLLEADKVTVNNGTYLLIDENSDRPKNIDYSKIFLILNNFTILGPDIKTSIQKMSFLDHRGLFLRNLSGEYLYTKNTMSLTNIDLITNNSLFMGDIVLKYKEGDFQNFTDKVHFDAKIKQASIATNDIRYFSKEIGKDNFFSIKTRATGPLNNLFFKDLYLTDSKKTQIVGNLNLKNLLGNINQHLYMKGDFKKIVSSYDNLTQLLPNLLGKKLPSSLQKIGQFVFKGKAEVSSTAIVTDFYMTTQIGNIKSNLKINNIDNIDNASYKGNIVLEDFNLGYFLDRKDLEKTSLNLDVNGKGFKQRNLNTIFTGDVFKLRYNGYTYTKIILDGKFKNQIFDGKAVINDPNLFLDFQGKINFDKKDIDFDLEANIDYANLVNLKFVKKDTISVIKGNAKLNVSGTSLDDLKGQIFLSNISYQTPNNIYYLDNFTINSCFDDDNVRIITIDSPDIIEGKLVGKYKVNQLGKMFENSIGSLYTNYKPNKVIKGQYLRFNFTLYSPIVDIFFHGIDLGTDTDFRGYLNSDTNVFKLNFNSSQIKALTNTFYNINIKLDNKNPLYNAYIQMDSITTSRYKVQDFSLINITKKDTLFVRSEFKGGNQGQDYYNINLFHTIDKEGKNVVGIKKSELKFKDYLWYLNEEENIENKIVFDKKFKSFVVDNIKMTHEDQKIELMGELKNLVSKDFKLDFENVELNKVLPTIDKFYIDGRLNGNISFKQTREIYQPTASIKIDSLQVNNIHLGVLKMDIEGDESLQKFSVNSNIENDQVEAFSAIGTIDIANENTFLDIDLRLRDFNLGVLNPLGGDVISNIRGFASGKTNVRGELQNTEINGRLYLKKAGLKIPYLNTDYDIKDNSIVDVTERKFIFRNSYLTDIKYKTTGELSGIIEHYNFSDWKLDLKINSERLLVLDTEDSEDAAYYGTAFIDGMATIKGPTDGLFIKVVAKSGDDTKIKIPINDADASSEISYIHFVTLLEKANLKSGIKKEIKNYNGLELEFDFDIKPNAEIELILDRASGHGMKGKGAGTLLFKINTNGKFDMYGDFMAYEGSYNFKYGGLINKKFDIKKGSTINWEGDPGRANLNIDAVYKTKANPAALLDNPAINKKVEVDVTIGLKGNLSNPEPSFDIDFPTVNSILKSDLQSALADDDVRQKQALVLLSTGGFLSDEGINQSAITNNIYEKAGDVFSNIFKGENSANDKIDVNVEMTAEDRTPGHEADGQVAVTFSTSINDRISVNGKVGVPVGGINDAAVIGDVEIQYRVNEDGTLNLKVFNKENDINYVGEQIGYTQGVGISYEVDFDTFRELLYKVFRNQKLERENNPVDSVPDSHLNPEYINFQNKKRKDKYVPKSDTTERPPSED